MTRRRRVILAVLLFSTIAAAPILSAQPRHARRRASELTPPATRIVELQVRLDRAGFSVGEIDGSMGNNTTRAVSAYKAARKLPQDAPLAEAAAALGREQNVPGLATYRISTEDVAGPFQP